MSKSMRKKLDSWIEDAEGEAEDLAVELKEWFEDADDKDVDDMAEEIAERLIAHAEMDENDEGAEGAGYEVA